MRPPPRPCPYQLLADGEQARLQQRREGAVDHVTAALRGVPDPGRPVRRAPRIGLAGLTAALGVPGATCSTLWRRRSRAGITATATRATATIGKGKTSSPSATTSAGQTLPRSRTHMYVRAEQGGIALGQQRHVPSRRQIVDREGAAGSRA